MGDDYNMDDETTTSSIIKTTTDMEDSTNKVLNRTTLRILGKIAEEHSIQPWEWPDSAPQHIGFILRISIASVVLVVCILLIVAVNGSKAHRATSLGAIISSLCIAIIARGSLLEAVNIFGAFRKCSGEADIGGDNCPRNSSIENFIESYESNSKPAADDCAFGHFCYAYKYKVECPLWMSISEAIDMFLPFALLALSFERFRVGCGGRTGYCATICFVIFCWFWPILSAAGIYYLPEVVDVLPKLIVSSWRRPNFSDCRLLYSWYYWIITAGIRILPVLICFLAGSIVLCTKRAKLKCTLVVATLIDFFYLLFISPHYVMQVIFQKEVVLTAAVLSRAFNLIGPLLLFLFQDVRQATRQTLCGLSDIEDGSDEDRTPMKQDMDEMDVQPTAPKYQEESVPLKASPDDYSI